MPRLATGFPYFGAFTPFPSHPSLTPRFTPIPSHSQVTIGYLVSHSVRMGWARVQCLGGCGCAPAVLEGLPTFLSSYLPTFLPSYLPIFLPSYLPTFPPSCLPAFPSCKGAPTVLDGRHRSVTSVMTHTSIPVWATRAGVGDSAAAGAAVGMAVGGMECMLHIEHVRAQSRHTVPSDAGAKDRYFNGGELDLSQVQPGKSGQGRDQQRHRCSQHQVEAAECDGLTTVSTAKCLEGGRLLTVDTRDRIQY